MASRRSLTRRPPLSARLVRRPNGWRSDQSRPLRPHRDGRIETKTTSLASNSDRAQVTGVFVDRRTTNAEQPRELPRVDQRTANRRSVTEPLRDQVSQALKLIICEADQ